MNASNRFTVTITTFNRLPDLKQTLKYMSLWLDSSNILFLICDDGSNDGTSNFIKSAYPQIRLLRNEVSKGLIYSRNRLLNEVKTEFAISLDDDAHFHEAPKLNDITAYFEQHKTCGLLALRIFWGIALPKNTISDESPRRVQSFVGCGHIWRMSAWRSIPDYPSWFKFYGEEDFASYHLFKSHLEVHYYPKILIHHRVDMTKRKTNADYYLRLRRSLRSGWYLYLLFYPWSMIPRRLTYTYLRQIKLKVIGGRGNLKSFLTINRALIDVFINLPRLIKQSNRFSIEEQKEYARLDEAVIYWTLENDNL